MGQTQQGDKQSKITTQKTRKMSNTGPTKNWGASGTREGHVVPASYKTLTVQLIYTVKSVKFLAVTDERKKST